MTLATVPRYESTQPDTDGGHAVVVGASIAGLCTARILADAFDEVTVIDRDPLPDEPVARRSVPQARQIHILWEAGRTTLEDLFPGYSEDLLAAGGVAIDGQHDLYTYGQGDFLAAGSKPFPLYAATRPLYEQVLRRHVSRLDAVQLWDRCQCVDYLVDDAATAVTGVAIRNEDAGRAELSTDLVVDATGRTSRTPVWLENHDYTPPVMDEVHINVAYSTTFIERPTDDARMIGVLAEAPRTRGGAVLPVEGDRWLVNLHGVHGDHPPTDTAGFEDFAGSLPTPELKHLLDEHPWVSEEIHHYPFQSNRRHRYEDLDRFPNGLVVVGDAIASFNPIYGQGMSVAALEALVLHHVLATDGREALALRFFARVAEVVDTAWMMAIGADFGFPQTRGPKPRGTALFDWYLSRLFRRAHTDGALTDAFTSVLSMQQPPTVLFRPRILWRVLGPARSGSSLQSRTPSQGDVTDHDEGDEADFAAKRKP
ncbi:NAD(P)/FAD-dependent oxidoreductase [Halalkalicoccus sp. NIPERK01]|uniref:FAD-dependent oxidoreductase n=1 Tax=Halalkalicoccus sp. NIPERK01 TaxID=3053469 RepID=UPI00256F2082|nr:FAD-dependent monooxygenase [Halalkalicoccus sp. NIPERK01]MDL5363318.1 FAD-dependent monooxygenase [Halalkalicoccus sp. NIPERK01]